MRCGLGRNGGRAALSGPRRRPVRPGARHYGGRHVDERSFGALLHSAVWIGSSMVIWGGGGALGSGGRYAIAPPVDEDGDGYSACRRLQRRRPARLPGAVELCDGLDNNCNGLSDEDFGDPDGDGWGDACDCAPAMPPPSRCPAKSATWGPFEFAGAVGSHGPQQRIGGAL